MNPLNSQKSGGRRDFLRQAACASLGVTGLVNTLALTRLMTAAMAQDGGGTGYKALICLFLNGGHDSNNLLIPFSGEPRTDYETGRGILALPTSGLHRIYPDNETREFGLHPAAQPLANLFNNGRLAFVCNVGTLSYPIATRSDYLNRLVPVPPQLFSHSDQQLQWQTSVPDRPFTSGWGGRVADLLNASYNPDSKVSMSISLAGVNSFQVGTSGAVDQYVVTTTGAVSLRGYGSPYTSALDSAGNYLNSETGRRLRAFDDIMKLTHQNLLEEEYNRVVRSARATEGVIGGALTAAAASGVDFDTLFAGAQTSLGDQLKMIAKLIAGRSSLGNNRQVFFCQVGGYDTHQAMLTSHSSLVAELANALAAFYNATVALGVAGGVTTFTVSDFNRTLTPNGTDTQAGSDHAWGGHAMVLGDAVLGRRLYGAFPSLKVGTDNDTDRNRGRWIPTTSVDQYSAVLARWFGVGSSSMEVIFPNLGRFNDPFTSSSANLNFLPAV